MLFCCEKLLSFLFVKTGRNTSRNNSSIHQAFLPCWLRWLLSVYDCSCEHWHWARLPATEHNAAKSSRRMRHWRVLGAIWCLITGEWRCRCVSMGHAVSSRSAGILSLVYIKHAATCHFLVVSGWQTTGLPMSTGHVGERLSTFLPTLSSSQSLSTGKLKCPLTDCVIYSDSSSLHTQAPSPKSGGF